jgi:uncharacterized membrane protein YbjE (DUF340 family)
MYAWCYAFYTLGIQLCSRNWLIRPAELEADGFASYVMVLISTLVGAVDMRAFEIRDSLLTIHVESA